MNHIIVFLIAGLVCLAVSALRASSFNMDAKEVLMHVIISVIGAFIGVKLLYAIQTFSFPPDFSGLSFFGAVYFAPLGFVIYCRVTKKSWLRSMDFVSLFLALALVVFRINCYMTGCCGAFPIYCFGKTVTPPIQLIEAFFDFLIFVFLWWRESKPVREGTSFPLMILLYGFLRLVMENYRSEERALCGMSQGQWSSILCFVVGFVWLYLIRNKQLIKRSEPQKKKR